MKLTICELDSLSSYNAVNDPHYLGWHVGLHHRYIPRVWSSQSNQLCIKYAKVPSQAPTHTTAAPQSNIPRVFPLVWGLSQWEQASGVLQSQHFKVYRPDVIFPASGCQNFQSFGSYIPHTHMSFQPLFHVEGLDGSCFLICLFAWLRSLTSRVRHAGSRRFYYLGVINTKGGCNKDLG